jgi:hypothetical protein
MESLNILFPTLERKEHTTIKSQLRKLKLEPEMKLYQCYLQKQTWTEIELISQLGVSADALQKAIGKLTRLIENVLLYGEMFDDKDSAMKDLKSWLFLAQRQVSMNSDFGAARDCYKEAEKIAIENYFWYELDEIYFIQKMFYEHMKLDPVEIGMKQLDNLHRKLYLDHLGEMVKEMDAAMDLQLNENIPFDPKGIACRTYFSSEFRFVRELIAKDKTKIKIADLINPGYYFSDNAWIIAIHEDMKSQNLFTKKKAIFEAHFMLAVAQLYSNWDQYTEAAIWLRKLNVFFENKKFQKDRVYLEYQNLRKEVEESMTGN